MLLLTTLNMKSKKVKMRKYLLSLILIFCSLMYSNAQSDGYFTYQYDYRENRNSEWNELIMLPPVHGLDYNYPADNVPVSSGLLLMASMGIVYANCKRRE